MTHLLNVCSVSVPKGRPHVSPGQRPGNERTTTTRAPNWAAITMNPNSVKPKPIAPPRWGSVESLRTGTQADGLGFHRIATLWRNRISCSDHRTSCSVGRTSVASRGIACIAVPKGQPYVSLGQRPRNAEPRTSKAPTGRPFISTRTRTGNALKSKSNPVGVAAYELQSKLPGDLKGKLPTAKQLAAIVIKEMGDGR